MSRPSALPRTPPGTSVHYPHLETLLEEGEDDEDHHPRPEVDEDEDKDDDGDDDDDTEEVITVLPTIPPMTSSRSSTSSKRSTSNPLTDVRKRPMHTTSGSKNATSSSNKSDTAPAPVPASLDDIKLLMREMEE